jgi:hypothetical protein
MGKEAVLLNVRRGRCGRSDRRVWRGLSVYDDSGMTNTKGNKAQRIEKALCVFRSFVS